MQTTSQQQQRNKLKQQPQPKIKKVATGAASTAPNNNIVPAARTQTAPPSAMDTGINLISKNGDYFLIGGFLLFVLIIILQKLFIKTRSGKGSSSGQVETEKGSAHFAERKEIKHLLKPMERPAPGDILIGKWNEKGWFRLKNKFVVLPRGLASRHVLVAAPSGAGKSRTLFLPNLSIGGKQSFLCTDPKSELWEHTSGKQTNPIRFAPMEAKSAAFNWIPLCTDVRTAKRCAEAIIHANEGRPDHFWTPGEQDLLTALFVHTAHTEQPTPAHVYEILTSGAEKLSNILMDSESEVARRTGTGFVEADTKVQTGFVQGLKTKLNWLDDPAIRRFTSSTIIPFSFGSLRHKPAQVYWCLRQSDVSELRPLTALFFNLATLQLLDEEGGVPMTFFYDEFANIGKLNNFHVDITLLRGQKIAVVAGLQSRSQLNSIYGPDNASTILENFNNKILLPGLQMNTAEDFSKMLGEFTYTDIRTSTGSSGKGWFNKSSSQNKSYYTAARRLMTADELRRLKENEVILYSTNLPPLFLETVFYLEPPAEAQVKEIGIEIETPTYTKAAVAPKQLKRKENTPATLAECIAASTGARAEQVDALVQRKPQPQPKQAAKPPAEAEAQTVIRARSGKLITRVEQLDSPSFTVEDLHEAEPEMEVQDYESIHEELEKAA
jgi:type IV secretory pathway TraG/TraD family ATPase VirD4